MVSFSLFLLAAVGLSAEEGALETFEERLSEQKSHDDYVKYRAELKGMLEKSPNAENKDVLHYMIARTNFETLKNLTEKNDIKSMRLHMKINKEYLDEAFSELDRALSITKSKSLLLDIGVLKFLIAAENIEPQKKEMLFYDIAGKLSGFSENPERNKIELARIVDKLEAAGLSDYALKLKALYALKAGREEASRIAGEFKEKARESLDKGDLRKANTLYKYYMDIMRAAPDADILASEIIKIADNYFDASEHKKALGYYEIFLTEYPQHARAHYAAYRISECLYLTKSYPQAILQFNSFLKSYPESPWFNDGFMSLAKLYFENPSDGKAIGALGLLAERYPERKIRHFARLLTGLLYYKNASYGKALENLDKIRKEEGATPYFYAADTLIRDMENIQKGLNPSFSFAAESTYRIWAPHTEIRAKIVTIGADDLKVKAGSKLEFELAWVEDVDEAREYLYDKEDISRLPREIKKERENDLLTIRWASPDGGRFLDKRETPVKSWQAPDLPGTYRVSAEIDDLGLMRSPDQGQRDDGEAKNLTVVIVVE